MNQSLLHHIHVALLTVVSVIILVISFAANSDSNTLMLDNYFLDYYGTPQQALGALWPENSWQDAPRYYESKQAAVNLSENMLGHYWMAFMHNDPSYDRSVTSFSGHLANNSGVHYDLGLSGRNVRLRLSYAF